MARQLATHDLGLTSFVGRAESLAEGRRLLGSARLVTLVGPGGIGKTRLARRLADDVGRAFPDGTFVVELAELRDGHALAPQVATAFGIEDVNRSPEAAVAAFVRDRRPLLVLDNCEHLVEACAGMVHALLRESSGLRVMATSRQPLGVAGEQLLVVVPLSLPTPADVRRGEVAASEAVELFVDRARLVVPTFEVNAANAEMVSRLCTNLDGMPLAIELAAARLRMLSLAQLTDRLDDRFGVLTVAATAALPRHQTLRASVDWSFELCSAEEQTLWAWMSVFEGGADLDAVEAVVAETGIRVFDAVAGLVDKSVLVPHEVGGRVRYRMLETIRDYGRGRLVELGQADELTGRHREYFVELARTAGLSWFGPHQRDLMARIGAEQANLRAAFDRCLATPATCQDALVIATSIWWYWVGRGNVDEATRWSDRALASVQEPTELTLLALDRSAYLAALVGDYESMVARSEALLAVPGFEDSDVARVGRRHAMAHLSRGVGDVEGSLDSERLGLAEEALVDRLGPDERVFLLIRVAVALSLTGRSAEALDVGDEATRVCLEHEEKWYLSFLYYLRGARLTELGRPQEALEAELEALRLARGGFNTYTVANALAAIARISSTSGDDTRAAVLGGALSEMWPNLGAPSIDGPRESHESAGPISEARARDFRAGTAYDAAFERGRRMSVDDIVSFVLDEHHPAPAQRLPHGEAGSPDLTRRETEIADLIARGLSNKDIAEKLVISPRTAEGHVTHLLHKLGFESRARVAAWVAERRAGGQ